LSKVINAGSAKSKMNNSKVKKCDRAKTKGQSLTRIPGKAMVAPHIGEQVEQYIKFEIRIQDSGVGISKDNLSKLFMNFSKLEEHADCNKRGTGLGLSICKSLIELMGGSVTVESEVGVGTTFIM